MKINYKCIFYGLVILVFPVFQICFLLRKQLIDGNTGTFQFEAGDFFIDFIRNAMDIFTQDSTILHNVFSGKCL